LHKTITGVTPRTLKPQSALSGRVVGKPESAGLLMEGLKSPGRILFLTK